LPAPNSDETQIIRIARIKPKPQIKLRIAPTPAIVMTGAKITPTPSPTPMSLTITSSSLSPTSQSASADDMHNSKPTGCLHIRRRDPRKGQKKDRGRINEG